ncbi:LpqB family beta-propeller domain-containing protein [Actinokineospora bangkokensis]|uniref:Uncharacterized protein n=1 Tax=Actinokineospora bangkokensis TaxID=1193682 RepID=A0A1Q9LEG2_9PSEU|nr:LpqB family beta-propeller domain-containing protein [Actinokineospora bangkokensis]OLR90416.1 hypothetical protein BJP25_27590 [Actinokineospora bangkokensis]
MKATAKAVVLALVALFLAGCSNIPESTLPKVIRESPQNQAPVVSDPSPGLNPYGLVGEFVTKTGYADAARSYLTPEFADTWDGGGETIIENEPKTTPPSLPEGNQANEQVVILSGKQVGRLDAGRTFFAQVQPVEIRFKLTRNAEGQWRISDGPRNAVITRDGFTNSYRRVDLQFFDPNQRVLVPDPRFVPTEPRDGLEGRVVQLLLDGPSDSLRGAVRSQLDGLELRTNVVPEPDGAIRVNFGQMDKSAEDRKKVALQVVTTLYEVTTSTIRLDNQDRPLVAGQRDWNRGDFNAYENLTTPKPDLLGLSVTAGRVYSLRDGKPIDGPAGAGAYEVQSAAQSMDGTALAVVQRTPTGQVRLRVGTPEALPEVPGTDSGTLTRPTWLLSAGDDSPPSEVWTVKDGTFVLRVGRTPQNTWEVFSVDATELLRGGGTITQLRLSRDGVRVAAVVNGEVRIGTVVRTNDSVAIRSPLTLQGGTVSNVLGLDWIDRENIVVATGNPAMPVASLPIDGSTVTRYNTANLTLPVKAIAASPNRSTLVVDSLGLWMTPEASSTWLPHGHNQPPGSLPFYPG